ncbi:MAG: hypothetical protein AB7F98_03455 [Novosphingobium sp.]
MSEEHIDATEMDGEAEAEAMNLKSLARDHAGLLVAGGLAAGAALAFFLTPKSTRHKIAQRTMAAATAAGEAGLKLGKQGAEKLEDLGETIGDSASVARERATKAAGDARNAGLELIRTAATLVAALRR